MTKSDFNNATKSELRAYVVAHPDDKTAFRMFVDRFTADAFPETFDVPQSKAEIEAIEDLIPVLQITATHTSRLRLRSADVP